MNHLNIANIHDNIKSQIWVGLDTKKFQIKNTGDTIIVEDKANAVTKLKVGGAAGFTISLAGGKISFTANSGGLLAISEPGKGGVPECPYLYSHQDKYGGSAASVSTMSLRSANVTNETETVTISASASTSVNSDEINIVDETKLPDPSELEDGTIMMVVGGHWVEYSFDDLYAEIISRMNKEYNLPPINI